MKTLLTGANGFLGTYLTNAFDPDETTTLGLKGCDLNVDLAIDVPRFTNSYDLVVHAAGLAHLLPQKKQMEQRFFDINVNGTLNLLRGLEQLSQMPDYFVFISTVAVYGVETGQRINESAPLKARSPYAMSKVEAESVILRWGQKNNVRVLILRLPLIVGKNPPGNLGTMIRSIRNGYYFRIGEGFARRSMVLAEDVANLISQCVGCSGVYNLTDGVHPSVRELEEAIAFKYGKRIKSLPYTFIKVAAMIGDIIPFSPLNTQKINKLTTSLTFSDEKARKELGWNPREVVEHIEF